MTEAELWYTEDYTNHVRFSYRVEKLLLRKQTKFQLLEILETPEFGRLMLLDGKVMLSQRDEHVYHEMLVHPAMLLHPSPKRILVVGGGDGGTIREVVKYPSVGRALLVDIDREVIEASKEFFPELAVGFSDPRVEIKVADAAKFARNTRTPAGHFHNYSELTLHSQGNNTLSTDERFDICFIDSTDPVGPGPIGPAEVLITDEFLDNVKKILSDDGIMVVQSESPVYEIEYLKNYVKRLKNRYPHVATYVIMVPSYSGLWSLTWASKTIDPFSEITRTPPGGLKYFTPELFRAALEMGKPKLWGPRPGKS